MRKFSNFEQCLVIWVNWAILSNFSNFEQIEQFWANWAILSKLSNFEQIEQFWANWAILSNFEQIEQCWGIWAILSNFSNLGQFWQFWATIGFTKSYLTCGKPLLNVVLLVLQSMHVCKVDKNSYFRCSKCFSVCFALGTIHFNCQRGANFLRLRLGESVAWNWVSSHLGVSTSHMEANAQILPTIMVHHCR